MNFEPAIAQLLIAAEACETNADINIAEAQRLVDQARLEQENAKSYRAGIALIQNLQIFHRPS